MRRPWLILPIPVTLLALVLAVYTGLRTYDRWLWFTVSSDLDQLVSLQVFSRLRLEVYDSKNRLLYQHGNLPRTEPIPVLSSSKWISATTLLTLVDEGKLSLDRPLNEGLKTASRLGPGVSKLTLRRLLSFTSGIALGSQCLNDIDSTLQKCAEQVLLKTTLLTEPGASFEYGAEHFLLAGAWAEKATGKSWNEIFEEKIRKPLGLSEGTLFYSKPRKKQGEKNPRLDGGLIISVEDYVKFLRMINRGGTADDGTRVVSATLVAEQEKDQFLPNTQIKGSFFDELGYKHHYGLGAWHECRTGDGPPCKNSIISSPGLLGTYPWIDRSNGYYAIFAASDEDMGTEKAIKIVQSIRPKIERALWLRHRLTRLFSQTR